MHDSEIHAVHDLTSLPLLCYQSSVHQRFEVVCKGRCRHAQMLADLADIETIISSPHQQPENCQARIMAKSGE